MNIQESIKKINFKKSAYPAISLLFFGIIALIFVYSIQFLLKNIDQAFLVINDNQIESQIIKVNLTDYYTIAKKFGIPIPTQEEIDNVQSATTPINQPTESVQQIQNSSTTESAVTSTIEIIASTSEQDKKTFVIEILNSTRTAGLASELKILLENAGFTISKTGNQTKTEEISLIKVKKSKLNSPFLTQIKEIVLTKYALGENQLLDETSTFDAIIVIGKK